MTVIGEAILSRLSLGLLLESRRGYDGHDFLSGSHDDFERNFCERYVNRVLRKMKDGRDSGRSILPLQ
jgi:hypothetical protein